MTARCRKHLPSHATVIWAVLSFDRAVTESCGFLFRRRHLPRINSCPDWGNNNNNLIDNIIINNRSSFEFNRKSHRSDSSYSLEMTEPLPETAIYPITTQEESERLVRSWGFNHVFTWSDGRYAIYHTYMPILYMLYIAVTNSIYIQQCPLPSPFPRQHNHPSHPSRNHDHHLPRGQQELV